MNNFFSPKNSILILGMNKKRRENLPTPKEPIDAEPNQIAPLLENIPEYLPQPVFYDGKINQIDKTNFPLLAITYPGSYIFLSQIRLY